MWMVLKNSFSKAVPVQRQEQAFIDLIATKTNLIEDLRISQNMASRTFKLKPTA